MDKWAARVAEVIKERTVAAAAITPGTAPVAPVIVASSRVGAAMSADDSGGPRRPQSSASLAAGKPSGRATPKAAGNGGGRRRASTPTGGTASRTGGSVVGSIASGSHGGALGVDVVSLAFEPPGAGGKHLGKASPVKDSVSVVGSVASTNELYLGGVRGVGKKITVADVFAGYNPGRELPAVVFNGCGLHPPHLCFFSSIKSEG
jgi:hypothetical protein